MGIIKEFLKNKHKTPPPHKGGCPVTICLYDFELTALCKKVCEEQRKICADAYFNTLQVQQKGETRTIIETSAESILSAQQPEL
jgi:hypothetical protein